jgi:hypothetical protein
MKKMILTLLIPLAFSIQVAIAQNAPISTIGNIVTYETTAVVPITVTGFTNIGSCELFLDYDPNVVTITSVTKGPGVSSFYFLEGEIDPDSPGSYKITWMFFQTGAQGLTLPDNSVFLNINFEKVADGYSAIEFNNIEYNCLYGDENFDDLNDTPTCTYYKDGSIAQAAGVTNWTGNVDNDWSDAANWTNGVPVGFKDAVITNVSPNLFPSANTNAECLGLEIASGASVTIPASSTLTVNGTFNNNGQFTVKSTAAGDGSFINNGAITGNGSFSVQRYLSSEKWHYVSPPVSDAMSGMFFNIYLERWNETTGAWTFITALDEGLNPMQGYAAWTDDGILGPTTVSYDGTLNTGCIGSGTLTTDGPNIAPNNHRGFNFVGNPYPSAIDWDVSAGWTKTDIANAIYIWNPVIGNYGSYVNGTSQNGVTNIIPSGQGFFVDVPIDDSTGSLTINNKARLHNNKPFFKSNTDNKLIKLEISSGLNPYSDQAVILFNEFATENFDPTYDAYDILTGLSTAPSLCSVSKENKLSINTLPETDEDVTIPLMFSVGINGVYTIEALEIENLENKYVYLKDLQENIPTNLNSQTEYSFFGNVNDDPARFEILVLNNALGVEDNLVASNLRIYSDKNVVYLINSDTGFSGDLNIYDMSGKSVYNQHLQNSSNFEATLSVEKGFYIVKLITNNRIITEKVFITK